MQMYTFAVGVRGAKSIPQNHMTYAVLVVVVIAFILSSLIYGLYIFAREHIFQNRAESIRYFKLVPIIIITVLISAILLVVVMSPTTVTQKANVQLPKEDASDINRAADAADINQLVRGKFAYRIPGSMRVGGKYPVAAIVASSLNNSVLLAEVLGDSARRFYKIDTIKVSCKMQVELIDAAGKGINFKIVPIDDTEQAVSKNSNTSWRWNVFPLTSGVHSLIITAHAKLKTELGEAPKRVDLYEKEIAVDSAPMFSFKEFINTYWKDIFTVLLLPLLIWSFTQFSARRKAKKEDEEAKAKAEKEAEEAKRRRIGFNNPAKE